MWDVIKILQLGTRDFNSIYNVPDYLDIEYIEEFIEAPKIQYDMIFVDKILSAEEIKLLYKVTKAYTLYILDDVPLTDKMKTYLMRCRGKLISRDEIQLFLADEAKNYFGKPYGEKQRINNFAIAHGFKGKVSFEGYYSINLEGYYGESFKQILYLRNNLIIDKDSAIEMWLEYEKDDTVEIEIEITLFRRGDTSNYIRKWIFSGKELDDLIIVDNDMVAGNFFVSIRAKGEGKLKLIALHDRFSRRGHGCFLPGGERKVCSNREEIFYYFDPGDMKPPLNVYFSGYKTQQGFEGYYMMKKMGCPFLLIAEPRLEGGAFYMGNQEYEQSVIDIIKQFMNELGFSTKEVIMSGLSMGTFGALYYGCDIQPHAIIIGKPIASVGDVALNERVNRPGGFPTSLDVVNYLSGSLDEDAISSVNDRFWDKFKGITFNKTKIVVSYMIEDDYDGNAYNNLIYNLNGDGVRIYGKGIHGRHNDASGEIVSWFKHQYDNILSEDFKRRND